VTDAALRKAIARDIQLELIRDGNLPAWRLGMSIPSTLSRMEAVYEKNYKGERWRAIKRLYKLARSGR